MSSDRITIPILRMLEFIDNKYRSNLDRSPFYLLISIFIFDHK